jgi:hypothetical protein
MLLRTSRGFVWFLVAMCSAVCSAGDKEKKGENYESAEYKVIQSEGNFEIREYPDLLLAATNMKLDSQDNGGGFMQLYGFISGANSKKQKIAMTTPVFMESVEDGSGIQMGFIMPKDVVTQGVPKPTGDQVKVQKRAGGRFAVVRFAGQMTEKSVERSEAQLRSWMKKNGFVAASSAEGEGVETAVYDSPFVSGSKRRNELIVRLKPAE